MSRFRSFTPRRYHETLLGDAAHRFRFSKQLACPASNTVRPNTIGFGPAGLSMFVEVFNYATSSFEVLDTKSESFNTDSVCTVPISGTLRDYVDAANANEIKSRVGWKVTGFTIIFPWRINIDDCRWTIVD